MNTLVYLVYGPKREYQLELTYSVLSAVHRARSSDTAMRIVLISDEASQRRDLPVENIVISPADFVGWTCGGGYHHEAKIHALARALDLYEGKVALVDTDTYFNADPARLFERIGPQRSVMHVFEELLGNDRYLSPILGRVSDVPLSYAISPETRLFNSGVAGLDYADRHLLTDVLHLVHELHAIYPAFNIEQFAFSVVLDKGTTLSECAQLVTHYYGYARGFIHAQIARLFPQFTAERFRAHVQDLPRVGGYPKKRAWDLVRARCNALRRREGSDYLFAHLACLSAHSSARRSPRHADVWARVAVDVLRQNEFVIADIERDFRWMRGLNTKSWPSAQTKEAWSAFWQEIAEARTRGQLRTTATSFIVPVAATHSAARTQQPRGGADRLISAAG